MMKREASLLNKKKKSAPHGRLSGYKTKKENLAESASEEGRDMLWLYELCIKWWQKPSLIDIELENVEINVMP